MSFKVVLRNKRTRFFSTREKALDYVDNLYTQLSGNEDKTDKDYDTMYDCIDILRSQGWME